ncbi:MAG: hypothetical protein JSS32_01030 [Verrucomicrobia bacterium]|nr:hypothetical protein [Verrucomicrobiota bacterium]
MNSCSGDDLSPYAARTGFGMIFYITYKLDRLIGVDRKMFPQDFRIVPSRYK